MKSFLIYFLFATLLCTQSVFSNADDDNHADQMNPNNDDYWESRGYDERPDDWEERIDEYEYSKEELDNHANQLNPNNDAYWESRGYDERPDNWEERIDEYENSQEELDNHANQLNPNNDVYWQNRGHEERPDDWEKSTHNPSRVNNYNNENDENYSESEPNKDDDKPENNTVFNLFSVMCVYFILKGIFRKKKN